MRFGRGSNLGEHGLRLQAGSDVKGFTRGIDKSHMLKAYAFLRSQRSGPQLKSITSTIV